MDKIIDLGLTADANEIRIFHCPSCSEEIDSTMESCPGCSALVDPNAAATEMAVTEEAGRAYTYVTYLMLIAVALPALYLLSWLLELEPVGGWGYTILWVATPAAVLCWWLRYRDFKSYNPAIATAKRRTIIPLAIWGAMLVIWMLAPVIYVAYQLRNLPENPATIVVIKDVNDIYCATPVSNIKYKGMNTIIIEKDTAIALGYGTEDIIADSLINLRSQTKGRGVLGRGVLSFYISNISSDAHFEFKREELYGRFPQPISYPYDFDRSSQGAKGVWGEANKDIEIEVKEVVLSKIPSNP